MDKFNSKALQGASAEAAREMQPFLDAVCRGNEEAVSIAHQIAAAPEMLSALRSARARLAIIFDAVDRDPRDDATVREIDAAIERATS